MKRTLRLHLLFILSFFFLCAGTSCFAQLTKVATTTFKVLPEATTGKWMLYMPALRVPVTSLPSIAGGITSSIARNLFTPPPLELTQQFRNGVNQIHLSAREIGTFIDWSKALPMKDVYPYFLKIQGVVDNPNNLFKPFAEQYYFKTFHQDTPGMNRFIKSVSNNWDPTLEMNVMLRFEQLAQLRDPVAQALGVGPGSLRLKYLGDVDNITPQNFKPENLILSSERILSSNFDNTFFPHLNSSSKIIINGKNVNVRGFGQVESMDQLYPFLLYGYGPVGKMYLSYNPSLKQFVLRNESQTMWVRGAEHEYTSSNPHIHLEELTPLKITFNGKPHTENVLNNLRIPLQWPTFLPSGDIQLTRKLLIEKPMRLLEQNPSVITTAPNTFIDVE